MFIATLAISGIPPFAGFFSKDAILVTAYATEHYFIWGIGSLTAGLTAFYMFRLLFTVFHASPTTEHKNLHSLPKSMTYPLIVLAFGSATAGLLGVGEAYGGSELMNHFLSLPDEERTLTHSTEYIIGLFNVTLGLLGMTLAYIMFAKELREVQEDTLFKRVIIHKFYIDELYEFLIIKPLLFLSNFIAKIIDPKLFDGILNTLVFIYLGLAKLFTQLQNGRVRYYAMYILIGVSLMSCFLIYKLGIII